MTLTQLSELTKICEYCEKPFTPTTPSQIYCSYDCAWEGQKNYLKSKNEMINCKFCDKIFKPFNSQHLFCSGQCRNEYRLSKIERRTYIRRKPLKNKYRFLTRLEKKVMDTYGNIVLYLSPPVRIILMNRYFESDLAYLY